MFAAILVILAVIAAFAYFHVAIAAFLVLALAPGAPLFWIVLLVALLLLVWSVEAEVGEVAIGTVVLTLLLFQIYAEAKPFDYVQAHPWRALLYALAYFAVGGLWSLLKWYQTEAKRFREAKAHFLKHYAESAQDKQAAWEKYRGDFRAGKVGGWMNLPQPKQMAKYWITLWPVSVFWTLVADYVTRIGEAIYEHLQGTYQRISDKVWGQTV
jgi:hypothetical protein